MAEHCNVLRPIFNNEKITFLVVNILKNRPRVVMASSTRHISAKIIGIGILWLFGGKINDNFLNFF